MKPQETVEAFEQALIALNRAVDAIGSRIPEPVIMEQGDEFQLRHLQFDSDLLVRLKALRVLSGMNAALLLRAEGFYQEMAVLLRVVRHCLDDILYMLSGERSENPGQEYIDFMRSFYEHRLPTPDEVWEGKGAKQSFVPRRKVRAAVARFLKVADERTFNAVQTAEDIALDGYIHPAYQHIMEMYNVEQAVFETAGSTDGSQARGTLGYIADTVALALSVCAMVLARDQERELVDSLLKTITVIRPVTSIGL